MEPQPETLTPNSDVPEAAFSPEKQQLKKRARRRLAVTVLLIAVLSVGFWQRQNLLDWWMLRSYQPNADVAALSSDTKMTDLGRKIFYLQKPQVQEKDQFYVSCEENDTTIVLGCYKPNVGIYVLNVTDQRLYGIEQVTAAHEMLHAAYARLSFRERERIEQLVTEAYKSVTDTTLRAKIDQYKLADADIPNELHSILGTEVSKLPTELETYYRQYFSNRQKVVTYAATYQSEFSSRKARVASMDEELKGIEAQVIANNAELDKDQAAIVAESKRLDRLKAQQKYDEYNQGVIAYNQSLVPFRAKLSATKALVDRYKSILDERNKVAAEAQALERALDSRRINTPATDI